MNTIIDSESSTKQGESSDGLEGRARIVWTAGAGYMVEVEADVSLEEMAELNLVMREHRLTWADRDEDGPLPCLEVDDITLYLLKRGH